jgi:hypothetical protein
MFKFIAGNTSAAELQRQVEEIQRAAATPVRGADPDFGARLKAAVKRRLASRRSRRHNTASPSDDESFAQKLARVTRAQARGIRVCRS